MWCGHPGATGQQHRTRSLCQHLGAVHAATCSATPTVMFRVSGDCRAAPSGSQRSLADFGHPRRRLTDMLLVLNVVAFGLQWYSKDRMLVWGAKAGCQEHADMHAILYTPASVVIIQHGGPTG